MYTWIKLLHILAAFAFVMAHGASASMALRLRREEKSLERMRGLLDLSRAVFGVTYAAIGISFVAGVALAFVGHYWSRGWIWLSLGLLLAIVVYMSLLGSPYYHRVRKAVGRPYDEKWKPQPTGEPASGADIAALLAQGRPVLLALVGGLGLAVVVGLMVFKPF
jgi:amino acid transporter